MKNILLIFILCMFLSVAVAQENSAARALTANPIEHTIGMTVYDLQSNTFLNNRIFRYDDESIGAVWTMGMNSGNGFQDRGTGYNFYDGTEWGPIPTERIENELLRTGWPSYAPWGPDGEIVFSHDFAASELYYLTRNNKGTGDWTETKYTYTNGPTTLSWARFVTTGAEHTNIHLLANSVNEYEGQSTAVIYSRSTDGGATWDIENVVLDDMGSGDYLGITADYYVWAEPRNDVLAFIVGGTWYDLFMMKSEDNGDSWEKTVIWEHPYPLIDITTTLTDTFFCADRSANIALDQNGMAHVAFGVGRVWNETLDGFFQISVYCDGIAYWNEDMDRFSNDHNALAVPGWLPWITYTELTTDYNYIGWMQDIDGDGEVHLANWPNYSTANIMTYNEFGASTMPTITVDNNDDVFVIYSSATETYEVTVGTDLVNYKRIWARAQIDGEWRDFYNLTDDVSHIFDECIYPQLAGASDDFIYYMYNTDITPGIGWDNTNHSPQDNNWVFASLPKSYLYPPWLVEEQTSNFANVAQNQPNPFTGSTVVEVTLNETADLSLQVRNIIGQIVYEVDMGTVDMGVTNITIDADGLPSGTYFYTVTADSQKITKKMIVN